MPISSLRLPHSIANFKIMRRNVCFIFLGLLASSGLSLCVCSGRLWTVSDRANRVYKISLTGETVDSLLLVGEAFDGAAEFSIS